MSATDQTPVSELLPDPAGAYGFRRRELIALLAVAVVVGVVTLVQWWQRSEARTARQWTVNDVYVDTLLLAEDERQTPPTSGDESDLPEPTHTLVDVNTATENELVRIPGIGPALAERIVVSRALDGPFRSLEDLQRVHGIGAKTTDRIASWVRFSVPARTTGDSAEVSR